MTAIQFLSTIKTDEKLRRSAVHVIAQDLFHCISSPVRFEPVDVQGVFHRDIEEAVFRFRNPLDSLVYLRSKGWSHDHNMHQVMENAHRHLQEATEEIFTERCTAMGYTGPVTSPSLVSISGKDYVAVQVDDLIPECCFLAVPVADGQVQCNLNGVMSPSKKSWLHIDAIICPYIDHAVIDEIKHDFTKYWQRTDFGEGPYHRNYLIHMMRELGL